MENYKTPQAEKIAELEEKGYKAHFQYTPRGLKNADDDEMFDENEMKLVDQFRYEGASNPDDMSILYVLETKDGKTKGTLVNAYGVYADADTDAFIRKLEDEVEK